MGKGGKYLSKQAPAAGRKKKKLPIVLISILVILLLLLVGGFLFVNFALNQIGRPGSVETIPMSEQEVADMLGTQPTAPLVAPEETVVEETVPEDTWPTIVSDQNITNIMLVGQAARSGETYRLSDTMILCSINRETNTLTMTSFMRDMRVNIPAYAGHTPGFSRMNVCYHLGSHWTGETKGSMEMLALAVEQNFGVHVDHTVEINFGIFMKISDLIGGVTVDFNEDEIKYMQTNYSDHGPNFRLKVGTNHINGWQALCYARMRKVGHGDFERTERQREVITSMLNGVKNMTLKEAYAVFTEALPMIVCDMTNEEITNYALEFLPMLKDLNLQSQRIPFEGTYWSTDIGSDGIPDWVIDCNLKKNGEMLRESIGMTATVE